MAYTVLARKYRPQTFQDLVGQEHVTRTLSNAIAQGRVAHAFLFTGVRGVGKTTTARILAKALNCENGPTPTPCGVCQVCVSITAGTDMDVLEMDGASNNSVEDVRRLQESIPYRPARDRFKIVIVDEVHMLSTGAFNAFLKTLEEPPEHVKFIFATTEAHKVPITIRSRCQRYDFRLIPQTVVANRVREILEAENLTADDAAVALVAREAAGSMRDALTLLDQLVAFGGDRLIGTEVAQVLGIADRDAVTRVAEATLDSRGADVLEALHELAARGLDMLHFARQLLDQFRDLVVLRVAGAESDLVAMEAEERARAAALAERTEEAELHRAFSAFSKVVEDVAQSATPRTTLEMGLVRLATRPPLRPLAELVARLEALEGGGGAGGGAGGGPTQGPNTRGGPRQGSRGAGPPPARSREPERERPRQAAEPQRPSRPPEPTPRAQPPQPERTAPSEPAFQPPAQSQPPPNRAPAPQQAAPQQAAPQQAAPQRAAPSAPPGRGRLPDWLDEAPFPGGAESPAAAPAPRGSRPSLKPQRPTPVADRTLAPPRQTAPPRRSEPPLREPPRRDSPPADSPRAAAPPPPPTQPRRAAPPSRSTPPGDLPTDPWARVVAAVSRVQPGLAAVLEHASPIDVSPTALRFSFPQGSFFGAQASAPDAKARLAEIAETVLGGRPEVEIVAALPDRPSAPSLVEVAEDARAAKEEQTRREALSHPLVREAQSTFQLASPPEVRLDRE